MAEARKFMQVVYPFDTARMLFECMHKACQGSQFNRVRDYEEEFYQKLEESYLAFEENNKEDKDTGAGNSDKVIERWFPDSYSKPDLPEKQPDDHERARPAHAGIGSSDKSSLLNLHKNTTSYPTGLSASI